MENCGPERNEKYSGLRAGEEMDRAMWRRKIISHTDDITRRKKQGEKKKIASIKYGVQNITSVIYGDLHVYLRGRTLWDASARDHVILVALDRVIPALVVLVSRGRE